MTRQRSKDIADRVYTLVLNELEKDGEHPDDSHDAAQASGDATQEYIDHIFNQ